MAVVKVMHLSSGATVRIHDDCFRDLSPVQLEERRAEVEAAIWRIDRNAQIRAMEANKGKEVITKDERPEQADQGGARRGSPGRTGLRSASAPPR